VQSRNRFEASSGKYSGRKAPVSSYDVVNASASYALSDGMKLSAGIENLFNSDYYSHIAQSHTFSGWNVKSKGRTVNLGLAYNF
jgi:iron complex outermembrane receptor protein